MTLSNTTVSFVPSIARRPRTTVFHGMSARLSQWFERTRGSPPPVGDHLRRDIGLDPLDRGRNYWDHQ